MLMETTELFGLPKSQIMDPVHGGTPVFSHEIAVIDHPLFQRLRHIRQNDILNCVFPGAMHSRFEHSIGTMHVAGLIFKNIVRSYLNDRPATRNTDGLIAAVQYCFGCLRIAALLHDVGHLPFSHQFEKSKIGAKLLSEPELRETLVKEALFELDDQERVEHEHISLKCAAKILEDLKKNSPVSLFEDTDILGMMENGLFRPSATFCSHARVLLTFFSTKKEMVEQYGDGDLGWVMLNLFKSIISGEVDADKMDYLLRDSYYSGCRYGSYNIDHLVQNICVGIDVPPKEKPWVGIAIRDKGLGALEDFVHSRFRMYLQLYNHRVVVGFKWILKEAIDEILGDSAEFDAALQHVVNLDQFGQFTDTYFWEKFRARACSAEPSACKLLIERKKLRYLAGEKALLDFEKEPKRVALASETKCNVIFSEASSKFSKISPKFDQIRLLVRGKTDLKFRLESIARNSAFFEKFNDTSVTHFYAAPEWYK